MTSLEAIFLPHPPIAIPAISRGEGYRIESTLQGFKEMAKKVRHIKPHTIIYITPHGNSFSNGVCLIDKGHVTGDFGGFGHGDIMMEKDVNLELTNAIHDKFDVHDMLSVLMDDQGASRYNIHLSLDHGVLVPMYFIDQYYDSYEIVHITPSGGDLLSHYKLGVYLKEVIEAYDEKVLVVCSGDLSHALKEDGPYKYHAFGEKFDRLVKTAIETKNPKVLLELTDAQERSAAQCGLRSIMMGFGLMDGHDYKSEVLSYEGPFGVGYLTGYLSNDFLSIKPSLLKALEESLETAYAEKLQLEDDYVKLARRSIETYVRYSRKPKMDGKPSYLSETTYVELLETKAGAFVSIHKNGRLRGCIGTTESTSPSLLDEIIYCAISACSSDPRFNAISEDELKHLEIKVDRLFPPERIYDLDELDVIKYGVIVEQGSKRGLLLPNLGGVATVEEQLKIAKQKANITSDDDITYYRFEVQRHE